MFEASLSTFQRRLIPSGRPISNIRIRTDSGQLHLVFRTKFVVVQTNLLERDGLESDFECR